MTTALDTNVIVSLWNADPKVSAPARRALEEATARGALTVCAVVFAELMAYHERSEAVTDAFFAHAPVSIDWTLEEAIWRSAGRAYQTYAARRRRQTGHGPRRILADFVIGAHAHERGYALLTLDQRLYRAAFPGLRLVEI